MRRKVFCTRLIKLLWFNTIKRKEMSGCHHLESVVIKMFVLALSYFVLFDQIPISILFVTNTVPLQNINQKACFFCFSWPFLYTLKSDIYTKLKFRENCVLMWFARFNVRKNLKEKNKYLRQFRGMIEI